MYEVAKNKQAFIYTLQIKIWLQSLDLGNLKNACYFMTPLCREILKYEIQKDKKWPFGRFSKTNKDITGLKYCQTKF